MRIIVADDDEFFRKLIIKSIQAKGDYPDAVFVEAQNGQQALASALTERPNLVITDVVMPEMDGTELSRKLKEKYPDLPILVVTAHDNPVTREELVEKVGVDKYLLKDEDIANFISELNRTYLTNIKFN